jgi:hypothetical protein
MFDKTVMVNPTKDALTKIDAANASEQNLPALRQAAVDAITAFNGALGEFKDLREAALVAIVAAGNASHDLVDAHKDDVLLEAIPNPDRQATPPVAEAALSLDGK